MKKIRVMIIEDSPVIREFLTYIINNDPRLEVVAAVNSAEMGLQILERVSPDVISMDIRLPGMNGFEATQKIMSERPTPVVVVSGSVQSEELNISMNALRVGALSVLEKPVGTTHEEYESMAERLCTQLAIMSQVKVVRQRINRGLSFPVSANGGQNSAPNRLQERHTVIPRRNPDHYKLLGIVASTGGPGALIELLNGLGRDFPLPILLVQHISAKFLGGFVTWLESVCPFAVVIAKNGELPKPGKIYVAPADHHLCLNGNYLHINREKPVCAQRPSGTVLFASLARHLGRRGIGVLLTGMGEDGATGLLNLRQAGGYTIAEDETTAVVYGMPGVAKKIEAVCESLPLPRIAGRIREQALVNTESPND